MRTVELWLFSITDPLTAKRRRTTYRLSLEEARERYVDAEPVPGSLEVREVNEEARGHGQMIGASTKKESVTTQTSPLVDVCRRVLQTAVDGASEKRKVTSERILLDASVADTGRKCMSPIKSIALATVLSTVAMAGHAAIVTTSLNNVVIGSETYNVTFSQDSDGSTSFNQVFGAAGSPVLTFTNVVDAQAAATALQSAADALDFDLTPGGVNNVFILPFGFTAADFSFFTGWSDSPLFDGVFGPFTALRVSQNQTGAFATFELQAQVPEPGTLALLGLVLAGLGFSRRRKLL